jgi:hypothetical protein
LSWRHLAAPSAAGDAAAIRRQPCQVISGRLDDLPGNMFEMSAAARQCRLVGVDGMLGYSPRAPSTATGTFSIGGASNTWVERVRCRLCLYIGFQLFGHVTTGKMNGSFTPQASWSPAAADGLAGQWRDTAAVDRWRSYPERKPGSNTR